MRRSRLFLIVAAVAVAGAITGALYHSAEPVGIAQPTGPDAAPQLLALSLPDLQSKSRTLAEWRGKVMVVNFWATWCPPCREEIPGFVRLNRKYADKGVQFVGISIDSADKVKEYADENHIDYTLLIGDSGAMNLAPAFGNRSMGLPFTVILDRSGATYQVRIGRLDEPDLEAILARLI
jgi:thiol-disulfide isomerase/thioredoxin